MDGLDPEACISYRSHTDYKALFDFMPCDGPGCSDHVARILKCLLPGLREETEVLSGLNPMAIEKKLERIHPATQGTPRSQGQRKCQDLLARSDTLSGYGTNYFGLRGNGSGAT